MDFTLKRTTAADVHFQWLVKKLDHELWIELKEDQSTYDQYNKVEHLPTAVLVYDQQEPVACGCFKEFDVETIEIKRMFVQKEYRGRGLSKKVLTALEQWAAEKNYRYAVLETSIRFNTARNLYTSKGYQIIPNYGPYTNLPESVCMKKALFNQQATFK